MIKNAIAGMKLFCLLGIVLGCENTEDSQLETETTTQELWSYPSQGEILYGEILKADLTGGDFGHKYLFEGTAGETVTFVVEWHEPESNGLGTDLTVLDSTGNVLGESSSWTGTKAHVDVTFSQDGTYYVYVGHYFWGWFGRYPYQLGADPHLCAQVTFVNSVPEWEGYEYYAVNNYEVGEDGDPWSYMPDFNSEFTANVTVIERDVKMYPCNAHIDGSCSDSDPQVCGGTIVGGGLYENACAFRTELHTWSSDFSSGLGAFTTDLSVCDQ